jgi:hypothetical protein
MEVIVRPLLRNQWAGVVRFKNCDDYLGTYFTRTGALHTGLNEEDTAQKLEQGATAARLEKALQKPAGMLLPYSEFWQTFRVKFGTKDKILDTDQPFDELQYLFLKTHRRVANGFSDNNPTANYIIINKEAEAKESNKHNQTRRKAFKEFEKLSLTDMRKLLRLYGHRSDNISAELVESKLFEIIERDPQKFFDKWVDNKRRETEFLITDAVAKSVIRKNKSEYKYGVDTLGMSIDDAINYLDAPEHRDLKATIINEVSTKE